jgi:hypothetical protein
METSSLIRQKKPSILHRWFTLTLDGYPSGARAFFGKETNSFANPVGSTLLAGMKTLLTHLFDGKDSGELSEALESIIKIRAVQDFSPSQALSFVFLLKEAVRLELGAEIRDALISPDELLEFESRIDALGLRSFDVYMKCREKIYELRTSQMKNMMFTLFKRADMQHEIPAGWSDAGKNMSSANDTR